MDFEPTERCKDYQRRLEAFMGEHVYPAEAVYRQQMTAASDPHHHPPIIEKLKAEARRRGLWNLFHPHAEWGPGSDEHRVRATRRDHGAIANLASEAWNCNAPDTGNMEVLTLFGTDEHKERWLRPLLDGEIRTRVRYDRAGGRLLRRHEHRDPRSSPTATRI